MPDADLPMDGEKAADFANQLMNCCYDAKLNRFELLTALGLVVARVFEDVPRDFLEGWLLTLRRNVATDDA